MAFVYILKTESGKYYVGSTINLEKRFKHHMGGYTPSTKSLRPLKILLSQEYKTLSEARSVEKKIKKLKRHDYIDKIVADGYIKLVP